jgi:CheY-like chemotaxis protein
MIVEDEAIPAMMLGRWMKQWGWEVAGIEATGRGAVDLAARTRIDAILMDIRLNGELDGIDAARLINGSIPVIFTTAQSDESTRQRAEALRPFAFLIKPVAEETLSALLRSLFGQ